MPTQSIIRACQLKFDTLTVQWDTASIPMRSLQVFPNSNALQRMVQAFFEPDLDFFLAGMTGSSWN